MCALGVVSLWCRSRSLGYADSSMKILVTGTEGYIGKRLSSWLIAGSHDVAGLDTGFYLDGTLYLDTHQMPRTPPTVYKDLRAVTPADLAGYDAVVHLAELSNDPLGELQPRITQEINYQGSVRLAAAARAVGIRRFIYASSCSVYGLGAADFVDEASPVNPQTAYARCKVQVERELATLATPDFCVVVLRNATAYGPSPRMRFDIVLNDLCALARTKQRIAMTSDGSPWRPIVHIEDICEAIRCALEAPAESVNGEIFNVGTTKENYRVREIATLVADAFPGCEVTTGPPSNDNRSYRVSFEKIANRLPHFKVRWTAAQGALELKRLFERIELTTDTSQFRAFTRLRQLQYLQRTGQLDSDLYWTGR